MAEKEGARKAGREGKKGGEGREGKGGKGGDRQMRSCDEMRGRMKIR